MKPDFRKSMIWLHTYSGLLLGWLLFTIFLTGTLSYFNPEITQWMQPELEQVASSENTINRSLALLHDKGKNASSWRIYLPNERNQTWAVQWSKGRTREKLTLGPQDGAIINPRETAGGNFFRVFHYTLQLRGYGGRYIAGIAAMCMLVAVFSGIFTHRRFFRDFFTLRSGKLSKTLTDFHALAGLVTIPFCIMICASGIMIYVIMYMPWSADVYGGGERQLSRALNPALAPVSALATEVTPLTDFSEVQRQVESQWPGKKQIDVISFEQPYHQNGRIIVQRVNEHTLSYRTERLVFSSYSGQPLPGYSQASTSSAVRGVFFGLHEGHFAGTSLRWLLFLLGIISSALIATGLIIWVNKRLNKVKVRHIGHAFVERGNIAAISGLVLAIVAFFWGNRLLPLDIVNRSAMEVNVFLCMWLICIVHSVIRPLKKAWSEQLLLSALGCLFLPLLDLYQDAERLGNAIVDGNLTYLGFCFFIFLLGVLLLITALWLTNKPVASVSKPTRRLSS
jgi:uncharacterized iron-regulated membrane protein